MLNREFQRRATRLALARAGLVCLRDANSGFYRPAKRPDPRLPKLKPGAPEQLQLNFYDPHRPLADIFGSEAYSEEQ
jgi:hypothetical protein